MFPKEMVKSEDETEMESSLDPVFITTILILSPSGLTKAEGFIVAEGVDVLTLIQPGLINLANCLNIKNFVPALKPFGFTHEPEFQGFSKSRKSLPGQNNSQTK